MQLMDEPYPHYDMPRTIFFEYMRSKFGNLSYFVQSDSDDNISFTGYRPHKLLKEDVQMIEYLLNALRIEVLSEKYFDVKAYQLINWLKVHIGCEIYVP